LAWRNTTFGDRKTEYTATLCGYAFDSDREFLTHRFWQGHICLGGLNRLRYSDLIAVKIKDFFGETSPQLFETGD